MVAIPRIHCHSAYKHYQMFHWDRGSDYGNSVFNTTYNFNGGSCFGGGFMGGLWGGLGMGLGAGLMNFLFGGMGMFGGGMSMFGGGFPMANWWGGSRVHNDGAGGKQKPKNNNNSKCGGKDAEYLHTLRSRLNNIKKASNPATAAKELYDDINAVIAKQKDDEHNTIDENNYKDLKADLEKLAADLNLEVKDGKLTEKSASVSNNSQVSDTAASNLNQTVTKEQAINVTLQFAKHNGEKVQDTNIKGSIAGVKMAADGKTPAGYIIDCQTNSASKFKLRYEVTINNGEYTIRCISRTHSTEDCKKRLYTPAEGIDFKKEGNLLVRVNNSDEPLVTEHKKEGYSQVIEYSAEDDDFGLPEGYTEVKNNEAEVNGKKVKVSV